MTSVILVFLVGLSLSAFFSGSETGFYRANRVRFALDARGGDLKSRMLLWLTNNPTLFVATTLIGNNLANYLTSLAAVLASHQLFGEGQFAADVLGPIVITPLVFVYGELLPKSLYFHAPNRLLRRGGLFFVFFGILFAPFVAVLWLLGRVLERIVGQSPEHVRLRLARNELQSVLAEGEAVGLLRPVQQQLARSVFSVANDPVAQYCTPMARIATAKENSSREQLLEIAHRRSSPVVVVLASRPTKLLGYVLTADVRLDPHDWKRHIRPAARIRHNQTHIGALIELESRQDLLAEVTNANGQTLGVVTQSKLLDALS